ncbi:unnamed protein product [Ectocarpus sp. 6 AP-2014]
MSLHRSSRHSLGSSSSRHSTISVGGTRYSSRGPSNVHAASLLCLQLWAMSELRDVLPPLGERARAARLAFLGVVAALAAAMVLSYPLGAIARLFSPSRPPSARRRLASAVFAVYLSLACLTLCLAEDGWTGLDAAYFSTATLTTVGCRDLSVRTAVGKLVASTLSILGPLVAALFWRDSARATTSRPAFPPHQKARHYSGRQGSGIDFTRPMSQQDEEEHQARVADAVWALVGFLMVLLGCAGVFLRASRGGGGGAVDEGGDLPATTSVLGAVFSALLALSTVG